MLRYNELLPVLERLTELEAQQDEEESKQGQGVPRGGKKGAEKRR
jgi:hypothetical protein